MPKKTVICQNKECTYRTRSPLVWQGLNAGARGIQESIVEPRKCIHGHGWMVDPNDPFSREHLGIKVNGIDVSRIINQLKKGK